MYFEDTVIYFDKIVMFSHRRSKSIYRVSQNLLESGEQYIVGSPFSFVFSGCLTRPEINAASIVLFKSSMKLNNFSSDKKHNL